MKKLIKSNLKFFIGIFIGAIISGLSVYAISASEITYNDTTVDVALDDIYGELNKDLIDRLDLTPTFTYSIGYRTGPKTVSINIGAGDYLVIFISSYAWPSGGYTPTIRDNIEESMNNPNCTSIIRKKIENYLSSSGSASFTAGAVYKCSTDSAQSVSFSHQHGGLNEMSENFILYSIKID